MRGHAVPREIRRTLPSLLGIYCWTQKERIQIEMSNGEYGGRVKRGVDQEEMMKARVRVGRELSQQQGILPVV